MYEVITSQPPDLIDTLRETWPRMAELLLELENDQPTETRIGRLRHIGALWYVQGGAAEVLAEVGIALSERLRIPQGLIVSELLLAYGAAQEEERTREWETHLLNRVAELDGLHRIICAANSTLDLSSSLQAVTETVSQVIGVEVCSIYLYEQHRDELVLRATFGLDQAVVGRVVTRLGEGVTGWAAQLGYPVSIHDILSDPRFAAEPQLGSEPFRSILAVPIVLYNTDPSHLGTGKLQGVINIQTQGPRTFAQEEINFVEVVSGELAFFIANAQLYQQTDERLHQKIRELSTLQQVSKSIAEQLDLHVALSLIAEKAVELSKADRADIFQIDELRVLQPVATCGGTGQVQVHNFVLQTFAEGKPLSVLDAFQDSRFPDLPAIAHAEGFHSLFCIPLQARGNTIGCICLYTRQPHHFDYDQVRLLNTFADEAAIAIENARLYAESKRALTVKSMMLLEMHHRVRNNLQTISALLAMQLRRLDPDNVGARALRESAARIQSIAAVHNLLCREDMGYTTVDAIARQVVESTATLLSVPGHPIEVDVGGEAAKIGAREATVLALIINELVSNAFTHGLAAEGGRLQVESRILDERVMVEVRDDGPLHPTVPRRSGGSGLGLQIIETLAREDMKGGFELLSDGEWMRARVYFPQRFQPYNDEGLVASA